jgi:hypothetical protein
MKGKISQRRSELQQQSPSVPLLLVVQEPWDSGTWAGLYINSRGDNMNSSATEDTMSIVLDLQTLDVPEDIDFFGNSGTSSPGGCCNGAQD